MNTMKNFTLIALLVVLACGAAFGQTALPSTTFTANATCTGPATNIQCPTRFTVTSTTGMLGPSPNGSNRTVLYANNAAYFVRDVLSSTVVSVIRGVKGTSGTVSHLTGETVYFGPDDDRHWVNVPPSGACTATNIPFLPVIEVKTGKAWNCVVVSGGGSKWGVVKAFRVPAADCTYAPTTLTTTNILTQVGASTLMVSQGTSNAAAGTLTMTCDIWVPSNVSVGQGAILSDITLFVGSQTTAPTSLGTSTLGSITFPAAATTETASTVTPVTVGGTVTTTSPTLITTVTTAGSFLTIKHTYGTMVQLNTDNQVLRYTMPFVQSAGAAMVINTPGLLVHFVDVEGNY